MELLLRARAIPEIGSGHVMRGAALAEAWLASRAGRVMLWGEATLPFVRRRLESLGVPVLARYDAAASDTVLVCDDYDRDVRADVAARAGFALRVLVDDLGGSVNPGFDAVWNPNAYASADLYPEFPGALLAGSEYIPVRSALSRWRGLAEGRVAVMLGGSRLPQSLLTGVRMLAARAGVQRFTGVGAWLPSEWTPMAEDDPWREIAEAACLVMSSGTTVWEAACAGVPAVVVRIAANQDRVYRWATDAAVPGVDALDMAGDAEGIAAALQRAVAMARPLPSIRNGAARVADTLQELARAARVRA